LTVSLLGTYSGVREQLTGTRHPAILR
jgi:hypothetical protein